MAKWCRTDCCEGCETWWRGRLITVKEPYGKRPDGVNGELVNFSVSHDSDGSGWEVWKWVAEGEKD